MIYHHYLFFFIILTHFTYKVILAAPAECQPEKEKNPLEEMNGECDPKRPNIFVDRNNLLGKPQAQYGSTRITYQYGNTPMGPAHWAKLFKQCGGKHQSPIDINLSGLKNIHMPKISWDAVYNMMPEQITVENTGYTVEVKVKYANSSQAKIQGGPMSSAYVLDNINFHWGDTDHKGGEHTINGKSFPMEMHAVHVKQHMSVEQALKLSDGLVIIAYIFEIEDTCHTPIKYIQESFELIEMDLNTAQPLQNMFPITELAEPFCSGYVTYKGSLTEPPCTESVTWIVSPYTVGISKLQLEAFRKLYDSSKNLDNNFRPVQPLNGRTVHFVN